MLRAQRADTVGTDARAWVDVEDGPISGNQSREIRGNQDLFRETGFWVNTESPKGEGQ